MENIKKNVSVLWDKNELNEQDKKKSSEKVIDNS